MLDFTDFQGIVEVKTGNLLEMECRNDAEEIVSSDTVIALPLNGNSPNHVMSHETHLGYPLLKPHELYVVEAKAYSGAIRLKGLV